MNTITTKGSYKRVKQFLEKGEDILNNSSDNEIFNFYYQYLIKINNKKKTITFKLSLIYLFGQYIKSIGKTFKIIDKEDVYNYVKICDKFNWCLTTKDKNKFEIKAFLNCTFQNNLTKISGDMVFPIIHFHKNENIRTYYTKDEIIRLLNVIDINNNRGKEDYLIISLICFLGLRISDVLNLKLCNINFKENQINIIQFKNKKLLILPLIDKVKYPLLDYLKNVRPKDNNSDYVFVSKNNPNQPKLYLKDKCIVKNYLTKAGIEINGRKHGYHALRHSFSTLLLAQDVSLFLISNILGHRQVPTTMDYLNIDTSKLKELALEVPYVK